MIGVHFVSKTPNYYISAILLSFPGLSMAAYWFMYREHGAERVRNTALFGMGAGVTFIVFLFSMSVLLKKHGISVSMSIASLVWLVCAVAWTIFWKFFGR